MRILITARYISGASFEGGSSRFMRCLRDTLFDMGHEVIATTGPELCADDEFDVIICSHPERFQAIKSNTARKIYISHGVIQDEIFCPGADVYISVSEEVRKFNRSIGINSVVIGQPVRIIRQSRPSKKLEKILVIRREPVSDDPFAFLSEKYDLRYSNLGIPIEEQINWADLCITLGRGAVEAMAQGKPVLVADNRPYIGAFGDGYLNEDNIDEISKCNFSGRRFKMPLSREWIENALAKYNPDDSDFLYEYAKEHHAVEKIINRYLYNPDIAFGVMINDAYRFNTVLKKSCLPGEVHCIINPESATKGINVLLDKIDAKGAEIGIIAHQDMYFRNGWIDKLKSQLSILPESWVVAGIVGKDMQGRICGNIHDMRIVEHINTEKIHTFPELAACFDECVIVFNMKKGLRLDESLDGFDLYGTLSVLQAMEMGGTAWIINAFAEHYCMRGFDWFPGDDFKVRYKRLYDRFVDNFSTPDSTVFVSKPENIRFETSA